MKKIILTTAIVGLSTTAFAQDYSYEYNYSPYEFQQQSIQEETVIAEPVQNQTDRRVAGTTYKNWDFSIGAATGTKSKYLGSDEYEFSVIPFIEGEYRFTPWHRVFASFDNGIGYGYGLTENLEMGLGLGYREGRDSKDSKILAGMQDIDDTLTYQAYVAYNYSDFEFATKLEKGMDGSNKGITTEFSAGYTNIVNPQLAIHTTLSTTFADSDYMNQNFSTTANAAAGRKAFNAGAGMRDITLSVGANYVISGPHNIIASAEAIKLIGDAKDSPVSEKDLNISAYAGYRYEF